MKRVLVSAMLLACEPEISTSDESGGNDSGGSGVGAGSTSSNGGTPQGIESCEEMCAIAISEFGCENCFCAPGAKEFPECVDEAEAVYSCAVERIYPAGECGGGQCKEYVELYDKCYSEHMYNQ